MIHLKKDTIPIVGSQPPSLLKGEDSQVDLKSENCTDSCTSNAFKKGGSGNSAS